MSAVPGAGEALQRRMRERGDPPADLAVEKMVESHGIDAANRIFRTFIASVDELPADAPAPMREFVEATSELPPGLDVAQAEEGARVLLDNAVLSAFVLLAKSLPEGYAAPPLARILHFTHGLQYHPYRRLLGVLQLLVNVSEPGAFVPRGRAVVTAQKLRLLHAGIRRVVRKEDPEFVRLHGVPVCQEDLIFTSLTFSHHVIEGLKILGAPLSAGQAQAYYAMWHGYALLQGIEPDWMPAKLEDAEAFCASYARHFVDAKSNNAGVVLTQADLDMLGGLVPWPLRALGLGFAPHYYMYRLIGPEAAARVNLSPVIGHPVLGFLLTQLPALWRRLWGKLTPDRNVHQVVSWLFFRHLIKRAWNGEVTFSIPESRPDLKRLV